MTGMPWQVLDLSQAEGHLHKQRGFLVFDRKDGESTRIPLDTILCLLITARQVTLSANLIVALADQRSLAVVCGPNMQPTAVLTPLVGNQEHSKRAAAQITLKETKRRRLWQALVRSKIEAQASALKLANSNAVARLERLAKTVKSGDPDNHEAQAAQAYWPALMGKSFRRRPEMGDANIHLNYGYAILRACMARAVVSAGLLPSIGLFHHGPKNPFVLVDDLMEPYRPLVDWQVYSLGQDPGPLDHEAKARLVALTQSQILHERGMVSMVQGCHDLATSLAMVLMGEREKLDLPALSPLSFTAEVT